MIKRDLKPGVPVVYIGFMYAYYGRIKSVHHTLYGIQVEIELKCEPDLTVELSRHLVPRAAYKERSWDGYTIMPYEWEIEPCTS